MGPFAMPFAMPVLGAGGRLLPLPGGLNGADPGAGTRL